MTGHNRNLVTVFRKRHQYQFVVSESETEISDFKISLLNDFTSECIRSEKADYEDGDELSLVGLCPSKHGGKNLMEELYFVS